MAALRAGYIKRQVLSSGPLSRLHEPTALSDFNVPVHMCPVTGWWKQATIGAREGAMTRGKLALLLGVSIASLDGCGTFHNTLAQDRVWTAEQVCKGEVPGFRIQQVYPDGRYYWLVDEAGKATRAQQCMDRELRNWRGGQSASGVAMPTSTPAATTGVAAVAVSSTREAHVPVWTVGDEWGYRYEGTAGSGTYFWSVARTEAVDGHECYVIKAGDREIFYRTSDLAFVQETVESVVVRRDRPPRPAYRWPLAVGTKWDHTFTRENLRDRQTTDYVFSWEVAGTEQVTVPAGTFDTFKVISRNVKTGRSLYEMWYAPSAKQYVKIHEWTESGERTREMVAYQLR